MRQRGEDLSEMPRAALIVGRKKKFEKPEKGVGSKKMKKDGTQKRKELNELLTKKKSERKEGKS